SHEWVAALVGLQSVGAVLVPLNTRYKGPEAAWILGRSRAVALITVDGFLGNDYVGMLDAARGDAGGLPDLRRTVVIRDDAPAGTTAWDDFLARGDRIDEATLDARIAAVDAGDLSDMLFTSGTTGRPKGVLATHGQVLRCVQGWVQATGLDHDDRYLIVNPFFHSFGYKAGIVACAIAGATMFP